jgi:hypothetical protein
MPAVQSNILCVRFDNNVQDGDLCSAELITAMEAKANVGSAKAIPGKEVRDPGTGSLIQHEYKVVKVPSSTMDQAREDANAAISAKTGANFCGFCGDPFYVPGAYDATTPIVLGLGAQSLKFKEGNDTWAGLGNDIGDVRLQLEADVAAGNTWSSTRDYLFDEGPDTYSYVNTATTTNPLFVPDKLAILIRFTAIGNSIGSPGPSLPLADRSEAGRFKAGDTITLNYADGSDYVATFKHDLVYYNGLLGGILQLGMHCDQEGQMVLWFARSDGGGAIVSDGRVLIDDGTLDFNSGSQTTFPGLIDFNSACLRGIIL